MFHIVYITKNKVNLKMYIGVHSTYDVEDGYFGSGIALKKAIKKYGIQAFSREVLFFCLNECDAYEIESKIVDKSFINRKNTYNQCLGGRGGDVAMKKGKPLSEETKIKMSIAQKGIKKNLSEESRNKKSIQFKTNNPGKTNTPEVKIKISNSTKERWADPEFKQKMKTIHKTRDKSYINDEWKHNQSERQKLIIPEKRKELGKSVGESNRKIWKISNSLGFEYIIHNINEFCKEFNLNIHTLRKYGLGKRKGRSFWKLEMVK